MRADQPRVVVTGLGATTPLGGDVASTWESLLAGRSGARKLPADWSPVPLPVQIAAPAAVDPATVLDRVQARRLDRCEQLAIVAAREAWADAGSPGGGPGPARRRGLQRDRRGGLHHRRLRHDEREGMAAAVPVRDPDAHAERLSRLDRHRAERPRRGAHHGERVRVRRRGHRLRHRHDPGGPGRRGAGRRDRGRDHPAERRGVRRHAGAVHPQRRAGARVPAVRQGPGRLPARRGRRHGGRWSRPSTRRGAAPPCTRSRLASVTPRTRTTSPSPSPEEPGS